MAKERASKRRKVNADSAPLPVHAGQITDTAGRMNGSSMAGNDSTRAGNTTAIKKRGRRSDAGEFLAAQSALPDVPLASNGDHSQANGASNGGKDRRARSGAAHTTPSHLDLRTDGQENGHEAIDLQNQPSEDVEMEDARSLAGNSQAESADIEAPRTSVRRRTMSRKFEEANTTRTDAPRASPIIRKARKTPAKGTPRKKAGAGLVRDAVGEPASEIAMGSSNPIAQRNEWSDAQPAEDAEIPDSEPESDGRNRNEQNGHGSSSQGRNQRLGSPRADVVPSMQVEAVHDSVQTPSKSNPGGLASGEQSLRSMPLTMPPQRLRHSNSPIDFPIVAEDATASAASELSSDGVIFERDELIQLQEALLRNLSRRSLTKLIGLGAETRKVANLIQQTITAGESNSMVLIGARGSGKTSMVDSILGRQRAEHGDEFHVVRLNGFIHTDDRVAIREIWRQLGREMEIDEDSNVKTHADTMITLLALLSHPTETGQAEEGRIAKSVIIVLDEFDLFATHPRQTLLYNLFDIAQSRKAPLAVLGLTTRYDVAEALEKRVKSRFSHRQVYLPLAKNFAAYKEMCKAVLTISDLKIDLSARWNAFVASLLDGSSPVNVHLQALYHTTKSVPSLQTSLMLPISMLRTDQALSAGEVRAHLESALSLCPPVNQPDSNLTLLPSLSSLELAMLICAARLLIIHDTDAASFPLAYDEYKSLASKARIAASAAGALATARVWGQGVARLAWEGLVDKGLVIPVGERARGGAGVCRIDVGLEEIGGAVDAGLEAGNMGKWCKEI